MSGEFEERLFLDDDDDVDDDDDDDSFFDNFHFSSK
jgi:hypothetical protein